MRPALRIAQLLLRPGGADRATMVLTVVATAVVTTLALTVVGGVAWFWRLTGPDAPVYSSLATLAVVLLVVPLTGLGGAAARLAARRHDERLSTLSLLGAARAVLVVLTVLEAAVLALLGAVLGLVGYLALMPVVGLVSFAGGPIGPSAVWLGWLGVVGVVLALVLVAAVSALVGLRRVVITPLGVRTRQEAVGSHWVRLLIGGVTIAAAVGVTQVVSLIPDETVVIALLLGMFAAAVSVLNVAGPFVVRRHARRRLKQARTAAGLIGARMVLEDAKAAWRQVGGLAMTSFVAVVAGTGLAVAESAQPTAAQDVMLVGDLRTGVFLTLGISFVTVACSVGVNQAADVLDRRDLYLALDRVGTPAVVMHRARVAAVMPSLRVVTLGSAAVAALVVAPLAGLAMVLAPVSVLVLAGVYAAGLALVRVAVAATRPVLGSVLGAPG